jgi:diguanylate cyclase (GGDEF)-like protein
MVKELDLDENLPITVIMGDLNGLKLINDAFGHSVGDSLLIEVSKIMNKVFCRHGIVARLGGDEFGVLLPKTTLETANNWMIEAKKTIEKEAILGVNRSISFGIASKTKATPISRVLVNAEDDMYARKLFETTSHRSDTIRTILQTLHEKNPREEAHSKRVSLICTEMGKALGMSVDEQNLLNAISNLHDIGKIAIDEAILNKPGKLDEHEWDAIKKHPDIGYRILSTSSEFENVAIDILSHHERYDGKAGPRGIIGTEIPLRARIIAIADAYDAMISMRTYRNSLTHDQAIQELIRCKNSQFDPDLIDVFLSLPGVNNL